MNRIFPSAPRSPNPPGTINAGYAVQHRRVEGLVRREIRCIDPLRGDFHADVYLAVVQRIQDTHIRIVQGRILARDRDAQLRMTSGQVFEVDVEHPRSLSGTLREVDVEFLGNDLHRILSVEQRGYAVDGIRVRAADHAILRDVAEETDLLPDAPVQGYGRTAYHDIGLNTQLQERLDAVLRGLGLEFPRGFVVGHLGDVHRHDIVPAFVIEHFPGGLDEMDILDVPDGAADFDDQNVIGPFMRPWYGSGS